MMIKNKIIYFIIPLIFFSCFLADKVAAACSALNYPFETWQRVWYVHSTGACLGDSPNENNVTFDNNWSNLPISYDRNDDTEFRSSRTIFLPAGTYTFSIGSDDGFKLWIDDVLELDKWESHGYAVEVITKTWTSVGNHKFRLDYYEEFGDARVSFDYSFCPPLIYPIDTWQRNWYVHSTGVYLGDGSNQINEAFDDNWGSGIIAYNRSDDIEFRSSRLIPLTAGTYTFSVGADDGFRLWIDDALVLDKWESRSYTVETIAKTWTSVGNHKFRLDYYESTGDARIFFNLILTALSVTNNQWVLNATGTSACMIAPDKPTSLSDTWERCLFQGKSLPMLSWSKFHDDNEGNTQAAYEIQIDDNASLPHNPSGKGEFSEVATSSASSYIPSHRVDEWTDWMDLSSYYWWTVRVKDNTGLWSAWSNVKKFDEKSPAHVYPGSIFTWLPLEPVQKEVVIFQPDETGLSYFWEIIEGTGVFTDGTGPTNENPHIVFSTPNNKMRLTVTDAGLSCSCEKDVVAQLPLPDYREVSPFMPIIWLQDLWSKMAVATRSLSLN